MFMHSDLDFGICWKFWGFSKLMKFWWNFWVGLYLCDLKTSCIASHVHYNYIFMHLDVCYICAIDCVLVGLDWAEPMMQFPLHVTCSCIPMHTFFLFTIFWYIFAACDFFYCFFLPFSLLFALVCFYGTQMQIYSVLEPFSFRGIHFFWSYTISCSVSWWEGQIRLLWELFSTKHSF